MILLDRIVDFEKYCPLCKYSDQEEYKEPCDTCLTYPVNEDSRKPVEFKEKKEKKK